MDGMEKVLDTLNQKAAKIGPVDQVCKDHNIKMYSIPSGEIICEKCEEEKREALFSDREKARAVELRKTAIDNAHKELNLPKRLSGYNFKNYFPVSSNSKKALGTCMKFVGDFPDCGGGVMVGGVGTGKTHLAVAVCNTLADRGIRCKISTISEIIRTIRSSWSGNATDNWGAQLSEQDVINTYSTHSLGLLVIDEIGAQYGTDAERVLVTEIINNRYEKMLPTILIGNVTKSEMEALVGARAVDRVMHNGFDIVFDWKSYRR